MCVWETHVSTFKSGSRGNPRLVENHCSETTDAPSTVGNKRKGGDGAATGQERQPALFTFIAQETILARCGSQRGRARCAERDGLRQAHDTVEAKEIREAMVTRKTWLGVGPDAESAWLWHGRHTGSVDLLEHSSCAVSPCNQNCFSRDRPVRTQRQ